MSASHFFVGLAAGITILAVPVLTVGSGGELPGRLMQWIEGPPPSASQANSEDAAPALRAAGQEWRAVRGLGGLVGWVPSAQVLVDGEATPVPKPVAATVAPRTARP